MPGDGLALAVGVGGEQDLVRLLGRVAQLPDLLLLAPDDDVLGAEAVLQVDPEGRLRQVADVTHRSLDRVAGAQELGQGASLARRLDDDQTVWHWCPMAAGADRALRAWPKPADDNSGPRRRPRPSSTLSRIITRGASRPNLRSILAGGHLRGSQLRRAAPGAPEDGATWRARLLTAAPGVERPGKVKPAGRGRGRRRSTVRPLRARPGGGPVNRRSVGMASPALPAKAGSPALVRRPSGRPALGGSPRNWGLPLILTSLPAGCRIPQCSRSRRTILF